MKKENPDLYRLASIIISPAFILALALGINQEAQAEGPFCGGTTIVWKYKTYR